MNNGSKPSNITLNITSLPYFSASAVKAGMNPVSRLTVGLFDTSVCADIEISIVGVAEGKEFLYRADFVKECFHADSYSLKKNESCVFDFDFSCFKFDNSYLNGIDREIQGDIYARVVIDETEFITKNPVTLLPANVWQGLEAEPSSLCVFVKPEDEKIAEICADITENEIADYNTGTKKALAETVKKLYTLIKECNIIYTRPAAYAAWSKQTVRQASELFGSGSVLATPLEIALLFCSAAERCGFDTSVMFVRTVEGEVNVLCGVYLVKSPVDIPVCENAEKIASLIAARDLIIVDPSVFAAAQNTSFSFACQTTSDAFLENPSSLVCMIDVKSSLKAMNLYEEDEGFSSMSVKSGVAKIYASLVSRPVIQYLSGKVRSEYEEIPLLYPDFDKALYDNEPNVLLPLESNVRLDDFAAIDKDFSSILTMFSPMAKQHFGSGELMRMQQRFDRLKAKVTKKGAVVCAMREERLYNTALRMTFGKNKREPYFALGYVKITDKLTELVSFAPICLVKASVYYDNGYFYVRKTGKPIVNKVFIRNALKDSALGYDSFMKSLMPDDIKEIFEMFENIRKALEETDDRHVYEIIRESHLVNIEIDDYILWSNLALERNTISMSNAARCIFGEGVKQPPRYNRDYAPAISLYTEAAKAVCSENDIIVTGAFTGEKEDVLYGISARSITEGKSMLVVTDDDEQSAYVKKLLDDKGLSDCVMCVDSDTDSAVVADRVNYGFEKYGFMDEKAEMGFAPEELASAKQTLDNYTEIINKQHPLGMNLKQAVSAYLYSCKGLENIPEIPVSDSLFENADEKKLEAVFEEAGQLISAARRLCEKSGMKKYTPIERHPLYSTRPARVPTEGEMAIFCDEVHKIQPVLSSYRDVFSDVNEILCIEEKEIDSLEKLYKINELYKLVISCADVEIPERFIESDIDVFVKNKRLASETQKRMAEIEKQLDFFGKEIFEDIEALLKGEEYEESEKGFIKKFMVKKNDKDTLLQYVIPSKRNVFSQHKISDIYALLYEYKACVVNLGGQDEIRAADDNSRKILYAAEKAMEIIECVSNCNDTLKKKRLSNVFRLICIMPVDKHICQKMTDASGCLDEVLFGKEGALSKLCSIMGVDFRAMRFELGILSFDGFSKRMTQMCAKLDCTNLWTSWIACTERTGKILPDFVKYLEKHGALENVDSLFAKSLLYKVCERIKLDVTVDYSADLTGKAKDNYPELLLRAAEISKNNILAGYLNTVRHVKQLISEQSFKSYSEIALRPLFEKEFKNITKILPIIIVSKNDLTGILPIDCTFDNVVCLDNRDNGYSMLPALGYGKRAVIMNMSRSAMSRMGNKLSEKIRVFDVCRFTGEKDPFAFTWLNSVLFGEKCSVTKPFERTGFELIRMNGTFERTIGRINKTEAEHTITKSGELCADKTKSVAITAFTKEQCTLIEKMLHIVKKKNRVIKDAIDDGRLWVATPDRLYLKKYDSLVVSACFGQDKDGRMGWDFGYAGKAWGEEIPEAYISISDRMTDKTFFLTSLNAKDSKLIRRTGSNAAVFTAFCEILSDGRIPVPMKNADINENDNIITGLISSVIKRNPRVLPCVGKIPVENAMSSILSGTDLFVIVDGEKGISMHDELLLKKSVEDGGITVTTLSPLSLAGEKVHETLSGFALETSTERISG